MEEYMTNENDLTQTEKNLRNFLQNGAAVKKLIDEYIANNENSITCDFCKKQYYLRTKVVHEKHCLMRLALESRKDPTKMSTFCLRAYGFEKESLKEMTDFAEVLKITMADRVAKEIIEHALSKSIDESYNNGTMEFLCPDGIWRSRDQVEKKEWYLYELRSLFQSRWEVKCCKYC